MSGEAVAARNIDPFDHQFLADPYLHHQRLRDAGSVIWLEKYDVVCLPRYEEVKAALDDHETFCSGRGVGLSDFAVEEPWRPPSIILEADPPLHTRSRRVLSEVLSRSALADLLEPFDRVANAMLADLVDRGRIDGVKDLAEAYPLSVFPDAVGIVEEGRENLLPYGDMAFNAFGPRNDLFERSFEDAQNVSAWIAQQCQRASLVREGIGTQIYAAADANGISEEQAGLLLRSLLTAGLDTTIASIGAALHCFATHPEQWQILRDQPRLARAAFAEVIRYVSPVQTFFRTTTREVEVDGVAIAEGQKVLLMLASANRDPRQWDSPEKFDIRRRTVGHVGFGHGIHLCVGQQLARLEGETLLQALAKRVARIDITGEAKWRLNNTLHALECLPIALVGG